jgi:peptidoglycan hydrolase-like protein with peptidoglycan-binding domain
MNRPVRVTLVVGAVGLAATTVASAAVGLGGDAGGNAGPAGPSLSTASVTRTSLTQAQQVNGTLDFGQPVTVNGRGDVVITWLPPPGSLIRRGQPLYRTDSRPVSLFYGGLPLYRQLHTGDVGDDVQEVEQNLAALGYKGVTVDNRYTAATASAVRLWQKALGLPQTGVFDQTDVVVAADEVRVASLVAHLGDRANGPTLTYTGTTRAVRVALNVAQQGLAKQDAPATVTLPDNTTVDGIVSMIGSVVVAGQTPTDPATIEVIVTVPDQTRLGTLQQAPVVVKLLSARVDDVLTVPVAALVALAEGGYGVQVKDGSATRYVAVQLGMFANGRVQVTGEGITEGTLVVVPS